MNQLLSFILAIWISVAIGFTAIAQYKVVVPVVDLGKDYPKKELRLSEMRIWL